MAVESYISELLDIMKREIQSFNAVNELLMLEEKSLVEFNTRDLADNLDRQEDVFSSIACLEKSRMDVVARIGELIGENPDSLTVSRLAALADESQSRKLLEYGHVLKTIHDEIRKKKVTNTMLVKQGIMFVESDIRVIMSSLGRTLNGKEGYSGRAKHPPLSGSVYIDGRM